MVSFSCDECQDVFTRAHVDRHFGNCRTRAVSCIDCGVTFDARSVRGHTACITEAEKYEGRGRGTRGNRNSFCATCNLAIPGAVAAEQHYASKKHRAQTRRVAAEERKRKEEEEKKGQKDEVTDEQKKETPSLTRQEPLAAVPGSPREKADGKKVRVKGVMKKVLRKAPKRRLREQALVKAVSIALGDSAPLDVAAEVKRVACKSRRFSVGKYVSLISK